MKFILFESNNVIGLGVSTENGKGLLDVNSTISGKNYKNIQDFIKRSSETDLRRLEEALISPDRFEVLSLDDVRILPPIERPDHDILCVGVNYRDHLEETKEEMEDFAEPSAPVYFGKRAIRIIGPGEPIKARMDLDDRLDYEVELAVIIGKKGKDIPKEKVEEHIFGYSVFNDLSSGCFRRDTFNGFGARVSMAMPPWGRSYCTDRPFRFLYESMLGAT